MYSDRVCQDAGLRNAAFHPQIKTEVTLFACSPPGQLFVAKVLGYTNIFLTGVDFGYTHGKDRFTNWTIEGGQWMEHPHPFDDLPQDVRDRMLMSTNGIPMDTVHAFYKKNMISAWRLGMQDVWTTGQSTITEMPYRDIAHVIRKQGQHIKGFSQKQIADASETYLASVGAFVVQSKNGYTFIESTNPLVELPDYMSKMNRVYHCTACNADMQGKDDTSQAGTECPVCHQKTVDYKSYCDLEANMERIRGRLKAAEKLKSKPNLYNRLNQWYNKARGKPST
jgi:DNA-directed RNA polymerase subunit RPC12/RpoP